MKNKFWMILLVVQCAAPAAVASEGIEVFFKAPSPKTGQLSALNDTDDGAVGCDLKSKNKKAVIQRAVASSGKSTGTRGN